MIPVKKALFTTLLLCSLCFGQAVSKAQRQDCSNAKEAVKKSGTDPNLTEKDLGRLLANLQQACGAADKSQPASNIRKIVADCSVALIAFDKNITRPDLPMDKFNDLLAAVQRDCRTQPGSHQSETKDDPQTTSEIQDSQAATDVHTLLAQSSTALNREIALGNRLVADLKKAQTWEGIEANHPDAVALRGKIAREEKEIITAVLEESELNKEIDPHLAQQECAKEELSRWVGLMTEATGVMEDVKTQQDRYHALGY